MAYIQQLDPAATSTATPKPSCFLCEAIAALQNVSGDEFPGKARQRLVLVNDDRGILLLNRYPYTNGHLLVAAREHVGELASLTAGQRAGIMELTALGERLLVEAVHPQGINIGVNIGRCAGAGLPGHLHVHLVPRWNGDTNFMQTIAHVRVIPQALEESYAHLQQTLKTLSGGTR
jgi:ATP adenylyltransferase